MSKSLFLCCKSLILRAKIQDCMLKIGLIREGKIPTDTRVALSPEQCKWLNNTSQDLKIFVQSSPNRCFGDKEYQAQGIDVLESVEHCDILLGIKEVPYQQLIPGKTYLFFSHTKKMQPYNQQMLQTIIERKITLIDYECLEHEDGQRIIGFGFFAGVVGAHNGIMAFGNRTGAFSLPRLNSSKNLQQLMHSYFGLKLPNIKIAVTGSGRVAHGVLEVMNLLGIHEVEPDEYLDHPFPYPVYTQLKSGDLYRHKSGNKYNRDDFHTNPHHYECTFREYLSHTDILMNGIYWDNAIPRLFDLHDISNADFRIQTIADITDDIHGSVPVNIDSSTIENPIYGVDKTTYEKTEPYLPNSVDVMAVGNLPNELPRDASRYFGEQLIKHILPDIISGGSKIIDNATIIKQGKLNTPFDYMREYAGV